MNSGVWWLWNQPELRAGQEKEENGKPISEPLLISVTGRVPIKLLLHLSGVRGWNYELVGIMSADGWEYGEARKSGRCLRGEHFSVLPASTHVRVAVFIRQDYTRLPEHLRAPICHCWDRLTIGKNQMKARVSRDTTGFLIEGEGGAEWVDELDSTLKSAGVGRTSTDDYEIERLEELCEKTAGDD